MYNMGFGNETERTQVPQADPYQYDVAQLSTGRFYYWGVPEPSTQTFRDKNMESNGPERICAQLRDCYLIKTPVTKNVAI